MRIGSVLAAITIAALSGSAHAAASWYWCEPLGAYFPWVRSCPVDWRAVSPGSAVPQSHSSAPTPEAGTAPVQPSASAKDDPPTFPSPSPAPRGDGLDAWCKGSITALNVALCGDDELRAQAVERLHVFDEAKARLPASRQNVLAADQNGWAMSSAQSCGIEPNIRPNLPLPPSVKECLTRAGQARLAYLRSYGTAKATSNPPPTATANSGIPATAKPPPATDNTEPAAAHAAPSPPPAASQQPPAPQPAPALPANAPTSAETSTPAVRPPAPCGPSLTTIRDNPFTAARIPSLGTLQGKTMVAMALAAAATVGLWVFAVFRHMRRQPG